MHHFPRYEHYKDSGVAWLGEIPAHWELKRLKFLVSEKLKYGANEAGCLYSPDLPRYIRITDFEQSGKLSQENKLSLDWKLGKDYLLNDGDILFARSGATVGKTYQFKKSMSVEENYCYAGYLIKAVPNENEVLSDFLFLFTNSKSFNGWKESIFIKATIENIGADKYSQLWVAVPSLQEQFCVVKFIQHITEKIDRAITQKEKLIALLQERRQILIHQAVTRGLNPKAPMKDSGVAWLGQVPAHWEVKKLKYLFNELDSRTKTGNETLLSLRMNIGLVPHDDVSNKEITDENLIGYKKVSVGQMVMNRMRASIGLFGIAPQEGLVSPDYAIYGISRDIFPEYYLELFKTSEMGAVFRINSKGLGNGSSGFMRLYNEHFGGIAVAVPPLTEQREIAEYIQAIRAKIATAIACKQNEIEKLKEYKATLINSAVTGKIKIPAQRNPEGM